MSKYLIPYFATLVVFCAIDFIWLGVVAPGFYKSQIGPLLLEKPNLAAAAVFYLLYAAGIVLFVVEPALRDDNWVSAAVMGALLGLLAYATYDLSNLATLKGWTVTLAIADIVWGMIVTGVSSTAAYFVARHFLKA